MDTSSSPTDAPAPSDALSVDASDGGAATCKVTVAFNTPTLLPGFDPADDVAGPHLSPDELTLYFNGTGGTLSDGSSGPDLYSASRAKTADAFGVPKRLAISTALNDYDPSAASDGLTLFYTYDNLAVGRLWFATRGSTLADFSNPAVLGGVGSSQNDTQPFITADGAELWFVSNRAGGQGSEDIYVAGRSGSTFANPVMQATLSSPAADWTPTLSADRLTIYLASNRTGSSGALDIWMSHRATTTDTFPAPAVVPELNSMGDDLAGWLSPDNCRLYMASRRGGPRAALYIATRAP